MIPQLEPLEVARQLRGASPPRLLDVREPEEHAIAALPESRLIPLGELASRLEELADWAQHDVVVYCHHGIRSLHAIALLQRAGFQRLFNLRGGIDRWALEADSNIPRY